MIRRDRTAQLSRGIKVNRFATALSAGFVATVLVGGTAFAPIAAEAATATELKSAAAACKAEAKSKKINFFARRKYVTNCVARTVKLTPAEVTKIAVNVASHGCIAEAKGKKIQYFARRKYVNACVIAALKQHSLDVNEVRSGVNLGGLRRFTSQELGCGANVYC